LSAQLLVSAGLPDVVALLRAEGQAPLSPPQPLKPSGVDTLSASAYNPRLEY